MYCQNCGTELADGARFCPECGRAAGSVGGAGASRSYPDMASIMVNKKSEALSLILSLLIPGLGQIYNGRVSKGAMMIVGCVAIMAAFLFFWPIIVAYPVLWIWGMYDAFTEAKEYNRLLLENNGQPPW